MRSFWLAVLFAPLLVSEARTWGQEGHSIVAEIAEHRLTPKTLGKIHALLKIEVPQATNAQVSLASIASWADDFRDLHPETEGWHFVDIPLDQDHYDAARDCTPNKGCVVQAIERFRAVLGDCTKSPVEREEALKFVVHFVGDVHQPLHDTERFDPVHHVGDQGGNKVDVTFFGAKTNLHRLWDSDLILHTVFAWGTYVSRLETTWLPGKDEVALRAGNPIDWAEESHRYAQQVGYVIPDSGILGTSYFEKALPVLDRQLAVGGLRLSRVLEETLGPIDCQ